MRDRRPRDRERLDQAGAAAAQDRQEGRRDRLGPGRHGLRAAARARRPRRACLSRRTPRPAACCATASPTSRWRRASSTAASTQMEAEGVTFHYGVACRRRPAGREAARRTTTRWRSPAAPRSRATCRSRAASSTASISPWISCRSRTAASAASRSATSSRSSPSGKHVVVIGGGDTGSDCIGTSIRQGALSVTNFEIMPQPPEQENKPLTWPDWPLKLRTSSSQEEGAERDFAVLTHEVRRRERPGEDAALRARRRASSSRSPAPSSSSRPISCCSPWASCIRCRRA